MAHRHVESVLGRLATDEAFRDAFRRDARAALLSTGLPLTPTETEAIATSDPALWDEVARHLDPRIQRIALGPPDAGEEALP